MMFASLFLSAILATVMAQDSPLTTITLGASAILPAQTSSTLPTVTNRASTITLQSGQPVPTGPIASQEPTVIFTSTITSSICGQCTTSLPAAVVNAAPTMKTSSVTRNATVTGVPNGGSVVFPVNKGNVSANGTIVFSGANQVVGAGSIAISAGLVAASFFTFVL